MRVDEVSEPLLRGLEKALSLSRSYFLKLLDMNVQPDWASVFDTLSWFHATTESQKRLCSTDFKLKEDKAQAVWALDYAKSMFKFSEEYVKKGGGEDLCDSFGC